MLQNTLIKLFSSKKSRIIYQSETLSSQQLGARAYEIIQFLKLLNLENQRIAFCLPNSPELLCWHIACFYLGIPIIPIIYEQTPGFIEEVIHLTRPSYLIVSSAKKEELNLACLRTCKIKIIDDKAQAIKKMALPHPLPLIPSSTIQSSALAMVIFSSESSGQLKGIKHTYESAYEFLIGLENALNTHTELTFPIAQSLGHVEGIVTTLMCLLNEGLGILLDGFEVSDYLSALKQYHPTHIYLPISLFNDLTHFPGIDNMAFSQIKICLGVGHDCPVELPTLFTEKTGAVLQVGYGMPEIGIIMVNPFPYDKYKGSYGTQFAFTEITLRDETGNIVQGRETGEIWVKSPALCQGYWNSPTLDQNFKDGWLKTHDLAFQDSDGYFWFRGRITDVIYSENHRLYPKNIEDVLSTYPAVKAVAVIGLSHLQKQEVPVAFVELKNFKEENSEIQDAILEFATKHLQQWQIPHKVFILEKLPLNLTGKIDRIKLKKMNFLL